MSDLAPVGSYQDLLSLLKVRIRTAHLERELLPTPVAYN
jgi:hypothetical protein